MRDGRPLGGFLYQYYRQHRAAAELRGAFISHNPHGEHKKLEHALDIVSSYYGARNLYADLNLGRFFPGDADSEDSANAHFGEFIIKLRVLTLQGKQSWALVFGSF